MDLAIILVHYHTPELAVESVTALLENLQERSLAGLEWGIWMVDNGSDTRGRERLASLPVRLLEPGRNLGYAGGINRAMEEVDAERRIILNPDVLVGAGCLHRVLAELERGADVVGPRFTLDREGLFLIPPTERRTRRWEILSALADRGEPWTRHARRSWRRHARRHWQASEPLSSVCLSGALLALSRRAWERAGPFDDGFRLYFEEDDWLRRVHRSGLETRYVPAAVAAHLHSRSASAEIHAGRYFADSRRRFRRRWYGRVFSRLLDWIEPGPELLLPWPASAETIETGRPVLDLAATGVRKNHRSATGWLELSPSPRGFPAAAHRIDCGGHGPWEMPEGFWNELLPGVYGLRWVDDHGRELGRWSFDKVGSTATRDEPIAGDAGRRPR